MYFENEDVCVRLDLLYYLMTIKTCYIFNGVVHICNLNFFTNEMIGAKNSNDFSFQMYFENKDVHVRLDLLYY